jgi:hypothetical protein
MSLIRDRAEWRAFVEAVLNLQAQREEGQFFEQNPYT